MSAELNGKVAIITGSGRGIGFGIAKKLAEKGAAIMISDVNEETAKNAVQQLQEMGATAKYTLCNVADWDQAQNLIATTIEQFGKLDILVNNAGINKDRTLKKMTKEEWDAVVAVNLTGMFYTMSPAIKHMIERQYGRQNRRQGAGQIPHHLQCHCPRLYQDGDDRQCAGESQGNHGQQALSGRDGHTGGCGQYGGVPGFRRRVSHDPGHL